MSETPPWGVPKSIVPKHSFKVPFLSKENAVCLCYVLPYEKIGNYLETPKHISGELHKPVETLPDAKGARRFARA